MAIPDLTRAAGRTNVSFAVAVPDNGPNTFRHNWNLDPNKLVEAGIVIEIICQGSSVTGATAPAALSADGLWLTVNFVQTGADQVALFATYDHSVVQ